ncbi:Formin-like protein 5 [Heracleum sosnowskyi]|uniref:Formin-like protein n=1 Tax=Heracleum sosnowskyi TaxID=360622 RepID=A0AAD8IZL7_9APIA|nr:Formin-like protein 5 [Heracleum sosnowskyi]
MAFSKSGIPARKQGHRTKSLDIERQARVLKKGLVRVRFAYILPSPHHASDREYYWITYGCSTISLLSRYTLLSRLQNHLDSFIAACFVAAFTLMASFLFCCLKGRRKKVHPKDGLRVGSPVKDFTSLSSANSFSDESEDSLPTDSELEAMEVPPGDTTENLPLPPGRVLSGATKSASGKKRFGRSANVNRFTINQNNSLAKESVSEEKVPQEKVSEEKLSKEKVPEEKGSESTEVPPEDTGAKLPLPPGRVPPPAPNSAPKSPASPKPAPPVPGSATPITESASQDLKPAAAAPPPPPPTNNCAPRAPPPPKIGPSPPNPPKSGNMPKAPPGKGHLFANKGHKETSESGGQKAKLKPFFWDKVLANPERSMVWNELKAGSFQFNEEMMEDLFGYNKVENKKNDQGTKKQSGLAAPKFIQIIDPKKAQNLSILLKALNVTTEEVCDAIQEGNELPAELIETLLKMAPTSQEELQLRLYSEDISKLGPADRFIKTLVDVPFAYQRLEALLFMCTLQNESFSVKECFSVLEVACKELRNSRLFLKLLEAVLKTGNRMNDGTFRGGAKAFKLDTLLKLSDVKGADGKTTLLHFVVQEIIRTEGKRAVRRIRESSIMNGAKTEDLEDTPENHFSLGFDVVSNLSNELENVKKAAVVDGDMLTSTVTKLGVSLKQSLKLLNNELRELEEENEFRITLANFIQQADSDILWMLDEETRITTLVKNTADYFHGTPGKDEGMRLFLIVRDFLVMVEKVCQEVKKSGLNQLKTPKKESSSAST